MVVDSVSLDEELLALEDAVHPGVETVFVAARLGELFPELVDNGVGQLVGFEQTVVVTQLEHEVGEVFAA